MLLWATFTQTPIKFHIPTHTLKYLFFPSINVLSCFQTFPHVRHPVVPILISKVNFNLYLSLTPISYTHSICYLSESNEQTRNCPRQKPGLLYKQLRVLHNQLPGVLFLQFLPLCFNLLRSYHPPLSLHSLFILP